MIELTDVADDLALDVEDVDDDLLDLRGLVMSGGKPYILIVLEEPETGGVQITHHGFDPDLDIPLALQELALAAAEA